MIRFHLKKLISDWEYDKGRHLSITELSKETGVNRSSLSRIASQKGYNTTTDNLNRICLFFGCKIEDLVEVIPEDEEGS
ncbi:helix-turn-helix domain-containing protein [Malonomonas rubra]|uniref:helix-turn-helix domain-containing protein n=1 Tax=Malonomonas rubra TaxID=57040 RepID=UPI0034E9446C